MKRGIKLLSIVVGAAGVLGVPAAAQDITLASGTSTAVLNPNAISGVHTWLLGGIDHMGSQNYFFRLSSTAPEASVHTISSASITNQNADSVTVSYTGNGFTLAISYLLTSAGANSADLAESVTITNTGSTNLEFHLFEFDDFDLNGSFGGDTATSLNANTIRQTEGPWQATVSVIPLPSGWQIGTFTVINGLMTNGVPDNLNNSGSPTGPADAAFAFQWDLNIAPGGSWQMSKDKLLTVPEPATMMTLAGLAGAAALRRRRTRAK